MCFKGYFLKCIEINMLKNTCIFLVHMGSIHFLQKIQLDFSQKLNITVSDLLEHKKTRRTKTITIKQNKMDTVILSFLKLYNKPT